MCHCKDESIKAFQYHSKPKWHRHHVQPLANSPLKPKLHRRTSLVNSELQRTIFVIFVLLSFASFYPSCPEPFPATKPQPSALNGEWNPSLIYPSTWLSIFVPQLVCGHVIRWTHAYKLHSLVMPNETYGTIVKTYCISIQSVGSPSHLASFRCMPGSTRVDEKGHCESSQSLGSRERTGSLGHRIIQGETCLVGGSILSIKLPNHVAPDLWTAS